MWYKTRLMDGNDNLENLAAKGLVINAQRKMESLILLNCNKKGWVHSLQAK